MTDKEIGSIEEAALGMVPWVLQWADILGLGFGPVMGFMDAEFDPAYVQFCEDGEMIIKGGSYVVLDAQIMGQIAAYMPDAIRMILDHEGDDA